MEQEPVLSHSHNHFHFSIFLKLLNNNLTHFCSRIRWPRRRRSKSKLLIKRFGKTLPKPQYDPTTEPASPKPIRIATFNAALFFMAPALPEAEKSVTWEESLGRPKSTQEGPRSILKQTQSPVNGRSKLRVSINLPENEISVRQSWSFSEHERKGWRMVEGGAERERQRRTVVEVLRELNADVLGLQDVKADEENEMKPLSDLARALGMNYVFAESWAPQYGNAVLSKWPIKRWKLHKLFDHTDFRNVLKATIDVPQAAGGLNSLDESDYSQERWTDIVKYYEEMGKPTPKVEVMKYLKSRDYTDAKDFAGECESVVMVAKGQSVQGTCKYGTRVDYILSSSDSPYKFVPGSYLVLSSKGTSDHHIVKVDVVKVSNSPQENMIKKQRQPRQKFVRIKQSTPSNCIWKTDTGDID
ncbi:uncharacterized protein LOC113863258 isoform X2 [Abrus precatorius]|uniref:Uncharacterized protein LOC113863258 isoform X2 n=1 Tax=Abrus precatorius TaxID=3816 RepID=A0A8B8LBD5_ABRPR|nr:uncharacterized protein LOC113863258 isoform X2 [Abrus precatorius]